MVHTIEKKFFLLWHGSYRRHIPVYFMPAKKELLTSTSLALGEAYMRGDIEVDRDLYEVLDLFLGEIRKFKTDKIALKKLSLTPGTPKKPETGGAVTL